MTTVAFDGKTLAADTLISQDNCRFGQADKCFRLSNGYVFAAAGATALSYQFKDWIEGGMNPDSVPKLEDRPFEGILIIDGNAFELTRFGELFPACVPWAGGSGWQAAMVAMRLGKTATEAVELAASVDVYTGGPITTIKVIE